MNVVAVAARSFALGTSLASGVRPMTCPPLDDTSLPAALWEADVAYVTLHGGDGDPYLRGDGDIPALSIITLGGVELPGTLVYMAGCWGAPQWSDAFLAAGARAVVADRNTAWAGRWLPLGSHAIGREWLRSLRDGERAGEALDLARLNYAATHTGVRDREMLDSVALYGDRYAMVPG